MASVELRNEVLFRAPTRIGLLADVTAALHDAGVNILAIGAYDKGDQGEFLMITSNNRATGDALAPLGGEIDIAPVVVAEVPNVPGELAVIARRIADAGFNISQIHATATDSATAMIVLRTEHEAQVVDLLKDL
ncbi:MAG: ACT domain-containing protein [Actinomycetota bacterium]|jgi:hypothetical protein|nr:ACT domain-containing protein [Actinomycetota bacterium]MDZ4178051.1 ACT domain-containing protein [Coriobacteriia bacterium]